ncbi:thermosome subunit gamma [Striga asiatica]|uniref:Thermosome subunit gamma n=1 Tax=Striga asiatica TaxID=4170 RepID=A0A5A7RJT5_STRAF|nr:thermosome subunit gamma [Striga asiatica]
MSNKRKPEDHIPSEASFAEEEDDDDSLSGEEIDLSETSSGEEDDDDSSSGNEIDSEPSTTQMSSGVENEFSSDDELKKLEIEEMKVILRHYEVKLEKAKLFLKVLKSRRGH